MKSTINFVVKTVRHLGTYKDDQERIHVCLKWLNPWYMIYIQGGPNSFFAAWTGDISETLPFCCAEDDCSGSWLGRARAEPTTVSKTKF